MTSCDELATCTAGRTAGPGSLFSLVFGCGWGSGTRLDNVAAGGLPTAKMAGSTKAGGGAGGGAGFWETEGAAGTTFDGAAGGASERSAMSAEGIVRRGFHSLVLRIQTVHKHERSPGTGARGHGDGRRTNHC